MSKDVDPAIANSPAAPVGWSAAKRAPQMNAEETMTIKEHLAAIQRGRESVEGNVRELRAEAVQLRELRAKKVARIAELQLGTVSREDFIACLCRAVDDAATRYEPRLVNQMTSIPYYKAPTALNLIHAPSADLSVLASRLLSPIPQVDITSDAVCFYFGDQVKAGLHRIGKKLPWKSDSGLSIKDVSDAIDLLSKEIEEIDATLAEIVEIAGFAGIEIEGNGS